MATGDWVIQILARKGHQRFVLFYINWLLFNKQRDNVEQLVKRLSGNLQDLGSIPGPSPFPYYFSTNAYV